MSKKTSSEALSKKLLSRPYWNVNELREVEGVSEHQFNEILESLYKKYQEIGITLELVQLHSKEYVVLYIESENLELTNLQLGILTIFAIQTKISGGFLSEKEMEPFLLNYYSEMQTLLSLKFIEKSENDNWTISPLGLVIIFPYIDDSVTLVQNTIQHVK